MEMEWQGVTMAAVRGSRRVALAADARSGSAVSGLGRMNSQVTTNIGCHDGKLLGEEKDMAGGQCDRDSLLLDPRRTWTHANVLSRVFLAWLVPMLWRGGSDASRPLTIDDFPSCMSPEAFRPAALARCFSSSASAAKTMTKTKKNEKEKKEKKEKEKMLSSTTSTMSTRQKRSCCAKNMSDAGEWVLKRKTRKRVFVPIEALVWCGASDSAAGGGGGGGGGEGQRDREKKEKLATSRSALATAAIHFWRPLLRSNILYVVTVSLQVSLPLAMRELLASLSSDDPRRAYECAALLLVLAAAGAIAANHANLTASITGVNVQSSLIALVVRKVLVTRAASVASASNAKTKHSTTTLSTASSAVSTVSSVASAGDVINLVCNDATRIQEFFVVAFHWMSPVLIGVTLALLYSIIGVACLAGFGLLFVSLLIVGVLAKEVGRLRREQMELTDERVSVLNDVLVGIRAAKLFGWERQFIERIGGIRKRETDRLRRLNYVQAIAASLLGTSPALVTLVTFSVYSAMGNPMKSDVVFPAIALLNFLQMPLTALPMFVAALVQAGVANKRLTAFFAMDEGGATSGRLTHASKPRAGCGSKGKLGSVRVRGSFAWMTPRECADEEKGGADDTGSRAPPPPPAIPCLRSVSLGMGAGPCVAGRLVAVTGSTASGKTSLLMAILGELHALQDADEKPPLVSVTGRVAYVGHESLILSATVRDNVLFGAAFDAAKYASVMRATCLAEDVALMASGDATEIGERGITISGGQKKRLSLARAIYSDADVYLLDDPLSALDCKVAKRVFDDAILGLLHGKTRILVTGNPDIVQRSDNVVVMKNGAVSMSGKADEVFAPKNLHVAVRSVAGEGDAGASAGAKAIDAARTYLASRLCNSDTRVPVTWPPSTSSQQQLTCTDEHSDREDDDEEGDHDEEGEDHGNPSRKGNAKGRRRARRVQNVMHASAAKPNAAASSVEDDELAMSGRVRASTYLRYMHEGAPLPVWLIFLSLFVVVETGNLGFNWWLTRWTDEADVVSTMSAGRQRYYAAVLAGIALGTAATGYVRTLGLAWLTTSSSINLHARLLKSVLLSPLNFFHRTPLGRVLNRFARDTDQVDMALPTVGHGFIFSLFACLAVFVAISIFIPAFVAVAVPICGVYILVAVFYSRSFREVVRIEALTRSPLLSMLSNLLDSPQTVRAYGRQRFFYASLCRLVQRRQLMEMLKPVCNAWLGISLELCSALVVGIAGVGVVWYRHRIDAGVAGVILTYSLSLSGSLAMLMRSATGTEAGMSSVERVLEYGAGLESEFDGDDDDNDDEEEETSTKGNKGRDDDTSDELHRSCCPDTDEVRLDVVGASAAALALTPSSSRVAAPIAVDSTASGGDSDGLTLVDVSLRYRQDMPFVLKSVRISIPSGSHAVVVGRTGSGKSSLVSAVFRLVDTSSCIRGRITIGGDDALAMPLRSLRRRLGVIPQEPVLFSTTVRRNLDPFDEHEDHAIWRCLEVCRMKEVVTSIGGLHAQITGATGGGGGGGAGTDGTTTVFSAGQAQLLCVARACLRDPEVLFADEATACVDSDTDAVIQTAIRESFPSTTIVSIAHRLEGIFGNTHGSAHAAAGMIAHGAGGGGGAVDRVIVMEEGRVIETGTPDELLEQEGSRFGDMLAGRRRRRRGRGRDAGGAQELKKEQDKKKNTDGNQDDSDDETGVGLFKPGARVGRRDTASRLRAQGREIRELASLSFASRR